MLRKMNRSNVSSSFRPVRKAPSERILRVSRLVGKCAIMIMADEFADVHNLGLKTHTLPVRVIGEYDRFFTVEIRPHYTPGIGYSVPYYTTVFKNDIENGQVRLSESEHDLYTM